MRGLADATKLAVAAEPGCGTFELSRVVSALLEPAHSTLGCDEFRCSPGLSDGLFEGAQITPDVRSALLGTPHREKQSSPGG